MSTRRILWGALIAVTCLGAQRALADEVTRTISEIGCNRDRNHCFVYLSGEDFAVDPSCVAVVNGKASQLRWDNADDPNGMRTFAALYGAFLAGRPVTFYVSGCAPSGFPTFDYFRVK
jgi:hypothetical protein